MIRADRSLLLPSRALLLPRHYRSICSDRRPLKKQRYLALVKTHDGVRRWAGVFDNFPDLLRFRQAWLDGSIRFDRGLWRLPTPWWHPDVGEGLLYIFTFPTVQTTNTGVGDSSGGTSHTCNLPASIAAGDLLVMYVGSQSAVTTISATGFTFLSDDTASNIHTLIGYATATGSEGATVTVTTGASVFCSFITLRISGWTGTPEKGTAATGSSTTPDPPNLTPSWGAKDNLWFAMTGRSSGSAPTGYPTNYGSNNLTNASTSTARSVALATRTLNASSEDPGTFTYAGSTAWVAQTLAVQPAAALAARSFGMMLGG